jgi:putative pyruvate formate lyase activating enzyme
MLCPRNCRAERETTQGFCGTGNDFEVAAIIVHHGEEPPISGADGICNIFFSGCNLQCVYCQNNQISANTTRIPPRFISLNDIVRHICSYLEQGIDTIGFVSPSHMVPQVKAVIGNLHTHGYFPTIVYNTNAYEKVDTLRSLEGLIDVYLPDFKYMDPKLAARWSQAPDYPRIARAAVKEMYRQKGNRLFFNEKGKLQSGMIVRHLVLPEATNDSIDVFRFLARELSNRLAVSLMAQYNPTPKVCTLPPLNRKITAEEYQRVASEIEKLGFETGWLQEFDSADCFVPDFRLPSPFINKFF